MTMKDYYNLSNNTTENCPDCNFPRHYISFLKGYRRCNCGTAEQCKICNFTFKRKCMLAGHLINIHNKTVNEYYDIFYKKENDGICLVCGKQTNFNNLKLGYYVHCSTICLNKSPIRLNKALETNIKKYGVNTFLNTNEQIIKTLALKGYTESEITQIRSFDKSEFQKYRIKAGVIAKKSKHILLNNQLNCDFYTKKKFLDTDKITIDHKIPIIFGYLNNIPVEKISTIDNLCCCALTINCYKNNFKIHNLISKIDSDLKNKKKYNPNLIKIKQTLEYELPNFLSIESDLYNYAN